MKAATYYEVGAETDRDGVAYILKTDKHGTKKWFKKIIKRTNEDITEALIALLLEHAIYNEYVEHTSAELRKKDTSLIQAECTSAAVNMWKALTKDEKAKLKNEPSLQ